MKSAKGIVSALLPVCEEVGASLGYTIWDLEYVKEGTEWFLRITIDSENGIDIDDCEKMSRAIDPKLDEIDIIEDAYSLQVSSPGIERDIKTDAHLEKCKGEDVRVKLFAPIDGKKEIIGELESYDAENVYLLCEQRVSIPKKSIAKMNVYFEF